MTDAPVAGWRVCLAVRSTTVTPEDVSRRLKMSADRTSSRPNRRWPYIWERESGLPPDADLDDHLIALADRCADATAVIAQLTAAEGVTTMIEAVLRGADRPAPGIWIPPAAAAFAAACRIGIDIDLPS